LRPDPVGEGGEQGECHLGPFFENGAEPLAVDDEAVHAIVSGDDGRGARLSAQDRELTDVIAAGICPDEARVRPGALHD
jgi:hypothetical protein